MAKLVLAQRSLSCIDGRGTDSILSNPANGRRGVVVVARRIPHPQGTSTIPIALHSVARMCRAAKVVGPAGWWGVTMHVHQSSKMSFPWRLATSREVAAQTPGPGRWHVGSVGGAVASLRERTEPF
eukprot:scaffold120298_cov33-Tisochrysis_lutea.AAC.2